MLFENMFKITHTKRIHKMDRLLTLIANDNDKIYFPRTKEQFIWSKGNYREQTTERINPAFIWTQARKYVKVYPNTKYVIQERVSFKTGVKWYLYGIDNKIKTNS